ncbi:MAG: cysteine desulfuration protein SufE [Pirellulaceae bacterium]|jgi:cysteine desulfuration protein SufE
MNAPEQITIEELLDDFELFDDWESRYKYIIELGGELPELPESFRVDENLVQGCLSRVWVMATPTDADGIVKFHADSDSQIVKGLISILVSLCNGRSANEIKTINFEGLFADLGLEEHLSRSRSNGFHSMVQRIRTLAGCQ